MVVNNSPGGVVENRASKSVNFAQVAGSMGCSGFASRPAEPPAALERPSCESGVGEVLTITRYSEARLGAAAVSGELNLKEAGTSFPT